MKATRPLTATEASGGVAPTLTASELSALAKVDLSHLGNHLNVVINSRKRHGNVFQRMCGAFHWIFNADAGLKRAHNTGGSGRLKDGHDIRSKAGWYRRG
jgi:hypothetical protein